MPLAVRLPRSRTLNVNKVNALCLRQGDRRLSTIRPRRMALLQRRQVKHICLLAMLAKMLTGPQVDRHDRYQKPDDQRRSRTF